MPNNLELVPVDKFGAGSRCCLFKASSKICDVCGYHYSGLTLKEREWICPDCKTKHDRDINAVINIKKFSLQNQNLIVI